MCGGEGKSEEEWTTEEQRKIKVKSKPSAKKVVGSMIVMYMFFERT